MENISAIEKDNVLFEFEFLKEKFSPEQLEYLGSLLDNHMLDLDKNKIVEFCRDIFYSYDLEKIEVIDESCMDDITYKIVYYPESPCDDEYRKKYWEAISELPVYSGERRKWDKDTEVMFTIEKSKDF